MKYLLIFLLFCSNLYGIEFSTFDSIVLIWSKQGKDQNNQEIFDKGSGLILGQDDKHTYILTAGHCLTGTETSVVYFNPMEKVNNENISIIYKTGSKHYDGTPDAAILKVKNTRKVKTAQFERKVPSRLFAMGCEYSNLIPSARPVSLMSIDARWLKTDRGICEGLSGGPLMTNDGKTTGIIIAESIDGTKGLALRADALPSILDAPTLAVLKRLGVQF